MFVDILFKISVMENENEFLYVLEILSMRIQNQIFPARLCTAF